MAKPSKETSLKIRRMNRILNQIHSYLDDQWFHPRRRTYLDAVVLTLLSKSLALARSVTCLVQNGFDEEAFGMSRSLLELALNLRYITNGRTPELRAKRFVEFVAKSKLEWGKLAVDYFSYSASVVRKDMRSYKTFQSLDRKYPRRNWLQASKRRSKGIWTMAMEKDRFLKVPVLEKNGKPILNKNGKPKSKPFTWAFDYEVTYYWTSQFVHVNIDSLDNHVAIPGKTFSVYAQGGRPSRRKIDYGETALFMTIAHMHRILLAAFRSLGHTYPEKLAKLIEGMMLSLAESERKARSS